MDAFDAKAADGTALAVLHVALGREDQPADAEGRQCRPYPEDYWLKQDFGAGTWQGQIFDRRLFADFCNDLAVLALLLRGWGRCQSRSVRIASRLATTARQSAMALGGDRRLEHINFDAWISHPGY
ncbi:MAG: hypothetical protein R3F36_00480 [Candidatus Competibacteraceae bacterium]